MAETDTVLIRFPGVESFDHLLCPFGGSIVENSAFESTVREVSFPTALHSLAFFKSPSTSGAEIVRNIEVDSLGWERWNILNDSSIFEVSDSLLPDRVPLDPGLF